ncbi:MAG: copper resistance protein CopC [Ilumatobacteraceae bacterium]
MERIRRRPALAVALLIAVLGPVLGWAGVALAHAELVASSPVNQDVLENSPTQIRLEFTESVDPIDPGIRLVDGEGNDIEIGDVDQSLGAATMRAAIDRELDEGSYVVAWQAISADSHRVRGAFTFSVGSVTGTDPGIVDGLFDAESDGDTESLLLGVGRFLSYGGVGVLLGGLVMATLLTPSLLPSRRVGVLLIVAAEVSFVGALWMIAAQAHLIGGTYWSWGDVWDTRSGQWWFVRLACLAVVGALIPLRSRLVASAPGDPSRLVARPFGASALVAVALAVLAVVAAGGHAVAGEHAALGFLSTLVHLAAMAVWLGGLALLTFGLPRGWFWSTVVRFSPWALGSVAALAISGTINGWRQLGSIAGLTDSTYGRWLIIKVLIVLVVVGVAAVSRRLIHINDEGGTTLVRRSVAIEVAGIALVLMATAGLVNSPPPPSAPQTAAASVVVGDRIVQVELEPAVTGGTEMHVYLTSPSGGLDRADEITVTAELPAANLGPIDIELVPAGPNHVIGTDANLPVAGLWTFEVTARYGEFDQVAFTVQIPVVD